MIEIVMGFYSRKYWEQKYLDLWSIVHFLVGVASGFAPIFFNMEYFTAIGIFFIAIIIWEILEWVMGVGEPFSNQVSDVVFGLLGFVSVHFFLPLVSSNDSQEKTIFWLTMVSIVVLEFLGWKSYRRYKTPIRHRKRKLKIR